MRQLTETTTLEDLTEARAKLEEVRRLLDGTESPELRKIVAKLERLVAEMDRVGRVVDSGRN
ncbi:hypothetical protein TA3x_000386 [Tundrisphaera sp. TA3]|uniref:hypothetical protein n=1 Tax=Tundrisphaera sp. TA3 TaxID=3435775 RepID=UPI003EBDA1D8